jgi:hypothetical protein
MITIHGSSITVQLPSQSAFSAPTTRQVVELIALDGSVIRQVSALQQSSKRLRYSGHARSSDAILLRSMITTSPSVVVAPGDGRAYTATINEVATDATDASSSAMMPLSFVCMITELIA